MKSQLVHYLPIQLCCLPKKYKSGTFQKAVIMRNDLIQELRVGLDAPFAGVGGLEVTDCRTCTDSTPLCIQIQVFLFFGSSLFRNNTYLYLCCTAMRDSVLGLCTQRRRHRAESGQKTALCGGEGSYRGLGVEGGGAMLEGVRTVSVWSGGGGTLPHAPDWLDGTRSCLERKQNIFYGRDQSRQFC